MSARAVKVNTVALGTGGCAEQTPHVHTVNGNKAVDSDAGLVEKELGTSQIPVAFFTDRAGEIDVADGLNFLFLQGAQHLKNDRKTAGIVGTGKIARELIRILKGFGMEIVANDLYPDRKYAAEAGIAYVSLDELYSRADIISLHCPLTDQTRYMIGDVAISHMKPGVILINTGRGQLIHTEALIDGLKEKKIGAAGLDVYEEEAGYFYEDTSDRIMDDDVLARLLSFNNVIVTSHQGFFTREAVDNIAHTTMLNIRDFDEHRHLENEERAEPETAVGQV